MNRDMMYNYRLYYEPVLLKHRDNKNKQQPILVLDQFKTSKTNYYFYSKFAVGKKNSIPAKSPLTALLWSGLLVAFQSVMMISEPNLKSLII